MAVIEFDTSDNILSANKNFLKTTGYQEREIVGKHHENVLEIDNIIMPSLMSLRWQLKRLLKIIRKVIKKCKIYTISFLKYLRGQKMFHNQLKN
jgi:PAS domain S-box-containing protein